MDDPYIIIGWAEGYLDEGGGPSKEEADTLALWKGMIEWTTTPPTEPGWYWVRSESKYKHTWIVEVSIKNGVAHMYSEMDSEDYPVWDGFATHWLGPLPPPEPPKG
jgi:hypothetical protein